MSILARYLEKKGISSFSELNDEEQRTYKEWEQMLRGRKLTDQDVQEFLTRELEDALGKLDPDLPVRTDAFIKMKIQFIRAVRGFLASPEVEREALISQIKSQL